MEYFSDSEFDCKCNRPDCDAKPMDAFALIKLDGLRRELGEPIHLSSARRCKHHNKAVGGSESSQHLEGRAFDIISPDGDYMLRVVKLALKHGFTGIGIKARMVHLDTRPGQPLMFGY